MIEDTKRILSDLIAFPTVSADSNLEMIAYIANRLEDCGAKVDVLFEENGQKAVRRQGFWHQELRNLRESLAHLVGCIMRRVVCDASVALRGSFV